MWDLTDFSQRRHRTVMQWAYKSLRYHLRRSVSVDRFARDSGLKPFAALLWVYAIRRHV
ncbi:hypothetical protein LY10_00093 [Planktotalea frisia]|uniref:Uncharacterized protein n=1 Tax=Planktotalea frisia TaxID=696762 RepID=A0A1L9NZH5_9RHOB|nr:hypothetical protein PFRI_11610 [Planktotalea frisia]PZX35709.1 hypothetical protein LY10_00093 [Planktotalea frisia]